LTESKIKGKVKSIKEIQYNLLPIVGEIEKTNIRKQDNYLYNQKGFLIECQYIGLFNSKYVMKYNDKNQLIEKNSFDSNGNQVPELAYRYDDKGNKIEDISYDSDGSIIYKRIFLFDENNCNVEINFNRFFDKYSSKEILKYDEKGRKVERNIFESSGLLSKEYFEYDEMNNVVEERTYGSDGDLSFKFNYKYDEKGNRIEKKTGGSMMVKSIYSYKYEFDKYENWIKMTEFENDVPKTITEREINYY
jgi:hypothetical protein